MSVAKKIKVVKESVAPCQGSIFDEPPPPPMRKMRQDRGSSGTSLAKIQGVVLRTKDVMSSGPRGAIPKVRVEMVVTAVIPNGASDLVQTGVPGEVFLLPSRAVDTPEQAEDASKFTPKIRELCFGEMNYSSVRKLSTAIIDCYKELKDGNSTGVSSIGPGMTVEFSNVHAAAVVSKQGVPAVFLNANKPTCLMAEAPDAGSLGPHMISLCQMPEMQKWAAFVLSAPTGGFFDTSGLSESQKIQATVCQEMWAKVVSATAERVEAMIEDKSSEMANVLAAHKERISSIKPADLASGNASLFLVNSYDCTLAPIVNLGAEPWDKKPTFFRQLLSDDPTEVEKLPQAFAIPLQWQATIRGNAVDFEARTLLCFDKQAALAADKDRALISDSNGSKSPICFTLSMKDMSTKLGTNLSNKVAVAVQQLLPIADFCVFAKLPKIECTSADISVASDFPEGGTIYLDLPGTLKRAGILVDEPFIKDKLNEGNSQYVPDADAVSDRFPLPDGAEMPTFAKYRYQELTYGTSSGVGGYKLSNLKATAEKTREFRVVFDGSVAALAANKDLAFDAAKGAAFIEAKVKDVGVEVKDFLANACLVYAIMV
jgi:hypothetical protein